MIQHIKGSTASIKIENNIVVKHVNDPRYTMYNVFERELFWLRRLEHIDFIPQLIDYNINNKSLTIKYAGVQLNTLNKPKDLHQQFSNILTVLREYNCSHNDMNMLNLLVKNNIVYLIDFGWSTFINDSIELEELEYFNLISNANNTKFPSVLNKVYRNNGKLDDEFAIEKLKKML